MAYVCCAFMAILFLGELDSHSTAMLYQYKHAIPEARVLYSVNSPYQKVEVIEDGNGERHLYLDGLKNLNSTYLEALNYYIAYLPAAVIQPEKTLLIGNGTLSSVPKVYPHSGSITSVELDDGVLEAGKQFFTKPEMLTGLDHWQLHIDDGKHFLRNTTELYDLVVVDVPAPFTIQEGYLHTVEFYRLVKEHLTNHGVIAVQLSGKLQQDNRTPARVTAALRQVFPEVLVVNSQRAGRSFAYGSVVLPFSSEELRGKAQSFETNIAIIPPNQVGTYLTNAIPLSVNNMDLVLRLGWERFADRYF